MDRKRCLAEELEVRALKGADCLQLRPLWEEVFFEDSEVFTDYYFKEKAEKNDGLALIDREGKAVSMLYLAPYRLKLRTGDVFRTETIDYMIGVATQKDHRKRGYMNCLLVRALHQMYERQRPFVFLMPADPDIYRPYQFSYIYDKVSYELEDAEVGEPLGEQEEGQLAEFSSAVLEEQYDVFFERDSAYYHTMTKELSAQHGGIRIFREQVMGQQEAGPLSGYLLYSREGEKPQVQEVWMKQGVHEIPGMRYQKEEPVIMARIVDVQAFLSLLRSRTKSIEWILEVRDPLLEANQGIWRCCLWPDRAIVEKISESTEQRDGICKAEIQGLAEWAFGYGSADECFYDLGRDTDPMDQESLWSEIRHFERIWINEIV